MFAGRAFLVVNSESMIAQASALDAEKRPCLIERFRN
jgi:hypothetical protein